MRYCIDVTLLNNSTCNNAKLTSASSLSATCMLLLSLLHVCCNLSVYPEFRPFSVSTISTSLCLPFDLFGEGTYSLGEGLIPWGLIREGVFEGVLI